MIKALILDYGNVISLTNTGDCALEMEALTANETGTVGIKADVFRTVYSDFGEDFDRGYITGATMYRRAIEQEAEKTFEYALRDGCIKEEDAKENRDKTLGIARDMPLMEKLARLDMDSWRAVDKDVVQWALEQKEHGYLLGILSNMPWEFLKYYRDEIEIFKAADYCAFSCECHYIKPEREIYDDCLKGLGIDASQGVFFDDSIDNVKAGNDIGLQSYLWRGLNKAKLDWDSAIKAAK